MPTHAGPAAYDLHPLSISPEASKDDLVWQDKGTGDLFLWTMNGAGVAGGGPRLCT